MRWWDVMRVAGIEDLGLFRVLGQPNLDLSVDRQKASPVRTQRDGRTGCGGDGHRGQSREPGAGRRKNRYDLVVR